MQCTNFSRRQLNLYRSLRLTNSWLKCNVSTSSCFQKFIDQTTEEYQYIERSKVPTFHFQKSLPRLPIPELEETCDRYLAAQSPLLKEQEFSKTSKLVDEFKKGEGKDLDNELRKRDKNNKHTSYISGPWFDMYLKDRSPLPLNYNPALVFVDAPPQLNTQLIRATNLVVSSLRFMKSLRAGILSPEVYHLNPAKSDTDLFRNVVRLLPPALSWYGAYAFKAFPLDMSQYNSLFNSTRVPKLEKDILVKNETARHLLVIRKGNFYKFDVLDSKGNILPAAEIQGCLRHILSMDVPLNKESLGVLTGGGRTQWAKLREHVNSLSAANAEALKDIDSALFAICFDDEPIAGNILTGMRQSLHGDGFNRWFDKSFSLIFASDGTACMNFEHSWGDGVAVLRYFQDILKDSNNNPFVTEEHTPYTYSPSTLVKPIAFTLDEVSREGVAKAKEEFDSMCAGLSINAMQVPGFGKKDCKSAKVSPDAVMQLAFQVAYHKAYDSFVATYESCSTAAYRHGRTETVRPCTTATRDFALAFNRRNPPSRQDLIQMMQKCSSVHGQLIKEAAMGNGFDRHLFALKSLAGPQPPTIFTDPAYSKINHNILSTSTLSSDVVVMGGFGPVVKDGLGVGYNILENSCGALVTSYPPHRDGATFISSLTKTIEQFTTLLSGK